MMRTMKDITTLFQPLEDAISQTFIPALTGRCQCFYEERTLLSLPLKSGGLNIINPVTSASGEYHASQKRNEPLKVMITKLHLRRKKQQQIENVALQVRESLPPPKERAMELLCEKGSPAWLSVLPLQDQGFDLNGGKFRDAISLPYGRQVKNVPHHCKCGKNFSANHAMICPYGPLPISRHNEIRDITTKWLTEVCTYVEKELKL